jgi:hypothetical protein
MVAGSISGVQCFSFIVLLGKSGSTSVPEGLLNVLHRATTPLDGFTSVVGMLSLVSLFVKSRAKNALKRSPGQSLRFYGSTALGGSACE